MNNIEENTINLFPADIDDIYDGSHTEFKLIEGNKLKNSNEESIIVRQIVTNDYYRVDYTVDDFNGDCIKAVGTKIIRD